MSIIRVSKKGNPFVQIDRRPLEDASLSWKAKGLHAYLLSRPDDWRVHVAQLVSVGPDGRSATRSALSELIERGYVRRERSRRDDGTFGSWQYVVYEYPSKTARKANASTNGKPECGHTANASTNGFSTSGLSTSGKPDTTNKENNNKEDTNKGTNVPKSNDFDSLAEEKNHFLSAIAEASPSEHQAILRAACARLYGFEPEYKAVGGWKKQMGGPERALKLLYRYAENDVRGNPLHYISAAESRRRREGQAPSDQPALPPEPEHKALYHLPEVRYYVEQGHERKRFCGAGRDAGGGSRRFRYFDPDQTLADLDLEKDQLVTIPKGPAGEKARVLRWTPGGIEVETCDPNGAGDRAFYRSDAIYPHAPEDSEADE